MTGLDQARADFAETVRGDGVVRLLLLFAGGCTLTVLRLLGVRR